MSGCEDGWAVNDSSLFPATHDWRGAAGGKSEEADNPPNPSSYVMAIGSRLTFLTDSYQPGPWVGGEESAFPSSLFPSVPPPQCMLGTILSASVTSVGKTDILVDLIMYIGQAT